MVCLQCSSDSAASDAIEYCIDKDFTKGLNFNSTQSGTSFEKEFVTELVKRKRVINSLTYTSNCFEHLQFCRMSAKTSDGKFLKKLKHSVTPKFALFCLM